MSGSPKQVKEQPGHPKYKARVARALEAGRKARTLEMERCKREGLPAAVLLNTSTLVVADFGMCERIRRGRDASPEEVKAALVLDSRMGDAARREAAMARWREATAATAAAAAAAASGGAGGGAGGAGGESDAATVAAVAAASAAAVAHAELHPSDEALAPFYSSYGPEEEMPVLQNTRVQKAYSQPPELRALYAAGRGYMRGARIDIYSAGVFLYVLLTGEYKLACGNQNRRILQFYRDVNASQQGFSIGDRVDRRLFQGQPVSREPSFWMSAAVELCAWACSPRDWERPTIQQMREHRWMQRSSAV